MKSSLSIIAISGIVLSTLSLAEVSLAETKQSPIVVTASRTSETADESLASVTVITREDIEKSQAREVADLLKLEAGIDISKNGGAGSTTSVFMRGANSNHTLFMIDGMRVSSATTGTFPLERLTLNDIDHIEIVRGPRSTQYGSDAIGGIIHIFTRKNNSKYARVGAGSFGTRQASAGLIVGDKYTLRLNGSYEQASGFSATNINNFSYNADDDAYRKNNYNISFAAPVNDSMEFDVSSWGSNAQTEYDQGVSDSINQGISGNFKQQVSATWSHKLSIGSYKDNIVTVSPFSSTEITTNRNQLDWQNDIVLSDAYLLLVGYSYYKDTADNINTGTPTTVFDQSIDNNALFANLSFSGEQHDFLLSLREDDHSNFGNHTTGMASWGMKVLPELRVIATLSNAFRAPSINELYHPGFDFGFGTQFAGNPNLKPETTDGGELGLRWNINKDQQLNVTYFSNWIENLITYSGTNFQAINVAKARTYGVEIQHTLQEQKWTLNTNITLQKAYDDNTRVDLLRRPRQKAGLTLAHAHSKNTSSRFEVLYSSDRLDFGGVKLPSYTVYNAATRFKMDNQLWFDARLDNITNKQYELASGYNTPDRSIFIGFTYEIN